MAQLLVFGLRAPFALPLPTTGADARAEVARIEGVPADELRLLCNGADVADEASFQTSSELAPLRVLLRLEGGKGGFGSMLRALGAQRSGHETDNIEACRDISGRRLRHINDEKKIAEWMAQQKSDEEDKEKRRLEKLERRTIAPKHTFDHHSFEIGLTEQAKGVQEAIQQGLRKKPVAAPAAASSKRRFLGDDDDLTSDSDAVSDDHASDGDHAVAAEVEGASSDSASASAAGHPLPLAPAVSASDVVIDAAAAAAGGPVTPIPAAATVAATAETTTSGAFVPAAETAQAPAPGPAPTDSVPTVDAKAVPSEAGMVDAAATAAAAKAAISPEPLDLAPFDSVESLEALGLDRLKAALLAANEKCGGTLRQRAERLFALKKQKKSKKSKGKD